MAGDDSVGTMRAANLGPALFDDPPVADDRLLGLPRWESLPYPGLRAFHRDEMEIFFGREEALDAMVDRLARTKFLGVLGPSGCGKSSLVRTGLYNALELGYLPHAGGRWKIAELNPGRRPIRNLARALAGLIGPADGADSADPENLVAAQLKRGPRAVVELGEGGLLADGGNLLIVVDQFEELFRFRDYAGREEADAFVALLLESARSSLPIHIVITMRSEYIGACSLVPGLAEQISEGMFLTPRMSRDECRQAIEGPARIRGFDIEPALVARILNDLQSFASFDRADGLDQAEQLALQADQLPLMQHLLNRMWRQAQSEHRPGRLELRVQDYDEAGGLTGALDAHGREILAALEAEGGPGIRTIVERVFRALVDGPSIALAVRSPRPFRHLVAAAGGEETRGEVERIVEAFRGLDCNFLRTSEPALDDEVIVDIGHESLIRRWSHLRLWFETEAEARAIWQRLVHDAGLWEESESALLGDLALRRVADWWKAYDPIPDIATRYGGDFQKVEAFRKASEEAEDRRRRARKRNLYLKIGTAFAAITAVFIVAAAFIWARQEEAVRRQQEAQNNLRMLNEMAVRYARESNALRQYLLQQYCQGTAGRAQQACLDGAASLFERDQMITDEQSSNQLSGGGLVP